ncbi:MAG: hypothetical protein LBG97_05855 [Coriobacteriales bacterium]|jgi:hypothetical protein|nr:hypothetical protein [Coriobacteriales bacterium]
MPVKRGSLALQKALANEKNVDRPTVYKGFYIYADQYTELLRLSADNKINGIEPSNASEMIRVALDEFLAKSARTASKKK